MHNQVGIINDVPQIFNTKTNPNVDLSLMNNEFTDQRIKHRPYSQLEKKANSYTKREGDAYNNGQVTEDRKGEWSEEMREDRTGGGSKTRTVSSC